MSPVDESRWQDRVPRPRAHWTPRYVTARISLELHERRHREDPWITASATTFLDQWLRPDDQVLEWGSGRSTRWLAARVSSVRSVEHDAEWARQTGRSTAGLAVELVSAAADDVDGYVGAFADTALIDLTLVDGIHRDRCALRSIELVRPGGVIVIDNVERYLPSRSRSPESIGERCESERWQQFHEATSGWRRYWTTNGVTDTAIFFRP